MLAGIVGAALPIVGKLIDDLFETDAEKAAAKLKLMEMEQGGKLKELETQLSAIVAEGKSADPWTSRARPSFLYVIYIYILAAIPMGILFAFNPEVATAVTTGVQAWLESIPPELLSLFGVGYLGYVGARSYDKGKILKAKG